MDVSGSDQKIQQDASRNTNGYSKLSSCGSICSFKDVANGNTRVVHRADNSPESSSVGQESGLLRRKKHLSNGASSSSSTRSVTGSVRSNGQGGYTSSSRGMQLRKLSGCYECHAIVDPARSLSLLSSFIFHFCFFYDINVLFIIFIISLYNILINISEKYKH